jgi:hypothetical protein
VGRIFESPPTMDILRIAQTSVMLPSPGASGSKISKLEGSAMRLEEVCVFEWHYDLNGRVPNDGFVLVRPYNGQEGSGYGEGRGIVSGRHINGTVIWANHPRRRSDGRMLPDVHGLIVTDDDARILFDFWGRTVFSVDRSRGGQNLIGSFESAADRYTWLNDVVCIAEGTIRPDSNQIDIRVYAGINELIEAHQ